MLLPGLESHRRCDSVPSPGVVFGLTSKWTLCSVAPLLFGSRLMLLFFGFRKVEAPARTSCQSSSEPGKRRGKGRLGEAACAGAGRCGDPGQSTSGFKMSAALWVSPKLGWTAQSVLVCDLVRLSGCLYLVPVRLLLASSEAPCEIFNYRLFQKHREECRIHVFIYVGLFFE